MHSQIFTLSPKKLIGKRINFHQKHKKDITLCEYNH